MLKKVYEKLINSVFIRSTGIYTISTFLNAGIPLLLLPILTTKLSPEDYGIIAMFNIVVSIIYPFVGLNLEGAVSRKYYDKDDSDFSAFVTTSISIFSISVFVVSFFFFLFFDKIQTYTQIPDHWLKFVLVLAATQFLINLILVIFQKKVQFSWKKEYLSFLLDQANRPSVLNDNEYFLT